jgi:hypothetical protein
LDDDDLRRFCDHTARTPQMFGQGLSQQALAAWFAVVERGVSSGTQDVL